MSNLTLDLIRNSMVGTPGYIPSTEALPTTSRPAPARRQLDHGAYSPRIAMSRPSEPQMDLLKGLLAQIAELDQEVADVERDLLNALYFDNKLTPGWGNGASQRIDHLKSIKTTLTNSRKTHSAQLDRPIVPVGRYAVTAIEGHTAFYSVEVNDGGFYTVYLQVSDDFQKLSWATSLTVLRQVESDGPLDAAKRYGRELGECPRCHHTLTNPASIAAGIGPKCATKYGA
jgi:hypothetical protein